MIGWTKTTGQTGSCWHTMAPLGVRFGAVCAIVSLPAAWAGTPSIRGGAPHSGNPSAPGSLAGKSEQPTGPAPTGQQHNFPPENVTENGYFARRNDVFGGEDAGTCSHAVLARHPTRKPHDAGWQYRPEPTLRVPHRPPQNRPSQQGAARRRRAPAAEPRSRAPPPQSPTAAEPRSRAPPPQRSPAPAAEPRPRRRAPAPAAEPHRRSRAPPPQQSPAAAGPRRRGAPPQSPTAAVPGRRSRALPQSPASTERRRQSPRRGAAADRLTAFNCRSGPMPTAVARSRVRRPPAPAGGRQERGATRGCVSVSPRR